MSWVQKLRGYVIPVLCILLGIVIGLTVTSAWPQTYDAGEWRLGNLNGYTNPLLECDLGADTIASRKVDFTSELQSFTDALERAGGVEAVTVYFRDLNNGPTTYVAPEDRFAPASLLKVPVLIAYLKWSEENLGVLEEQIPYSVPFDFGYTQQFVPTEPLILGETYTARALLERMIIYSDNQALGLLYKRIPPQYQEELYQLLGVDPALIVSPEARITVRQYSIFFRVLFNASYLSRANSEYALSLLARSSFRDGLAAGVPKTVETAHKFGERKTTEGLQQFHDCGIVYYPQHPYLLCVMTRGEDVQALIGAIAKTSEYVYQKIDAQYGR